MPSFESSAIARAEYDADARVLLIWFRDDAAPYAYRDVPEDIFHALCDAPSKGRFHRDHILDRFDYSPPWK
jgi:hypothetical protein